MDSKENEHSPEQAELKEAEPTDRLIEEADAQDRLIGSVFAKKYRIDACLGEGGMSKVYRGEDILMGRKVAIKILSGNRKFDEQDLQRFQREAKATANLNHQNIIRVHEFNVDEVEGTPYLVMDYIDGKNLSDIIAAEGPMEQSRALKIFIQICNALTVAHEKHIIHRDIKPSNILLENRRGEDIVRVVDFGIARLELGEGDSSVRLTQTGEIIGSPLYMSPEQCHGQKLDVRSDLYSLGCLMYETVTGRPPFMGQTAMEVLFAHTTQKPEPTGKDPDLDRVLMRLLDKDPNKRYQRAEALETDLMAIKLGVRPPEAVEYVRKEGAEASRKAARKLVASAIGVTCLIALGMTLAFMPVLTKPEWRKTADRGWTEESLGNYSRAQELYMQAFKMADKAGATPKEQSEIMFGYGLLQAHLEHNDKAVKAFSQVLQANNGIDTQHGRVLAMLSRSYERSGLYAEAIKAGEEAMPIEIRELGERNQTFANLHHYLSNAYRESGQLDKAEALARKYIDIELQLHPDKDSSDVAQAYEVLARALREEGKHDEALAAGREAFKIFGETTSYDTPQVQNFVRWLSQYLTDRKQTAEAREVAAKLSTDKP